MASIFKLAEAYARQILNGDIENEMRRTLHERKDNLLDFMKNDESFRESREEIEGLIASEEWTGESPQEIMERLKKRQAEEWRAMDPKEREELQREMQQSPLSMSREELRADAADMVKHLAAMKLYQLACLEPEGNWKPGNDYQPARTVETIKAYKKLATEDWKPVPGTDEYVKTLATPGEIIQAETVLQDIAGASKFVCEWVNKEVVSSGEPKKPIITLVDNTPADQSAVRRERNRLYVKKWLIESLLSEELQR